MFRNTNVEQLAFATKYYSIHKHQLLKIYTCHMHLLL